MKSKLLTIALTAAIALPTGVALAGGLRERPRLREAERDLTAAIEHIMASQREREWDEGHHAEKAKELIEHAKEEVRLAAEWGR